MAAVTMAMWRSEPRGWLEPQNGKPFGPGDPITDRAQARGSEPNSNWLGCVEERVERERGP